MCIEAVGMEAHSDGPLHLYDQAKQQLRLQTDRPTAVRQAIHACRKGAPSSSWASSRAPSTSSRSAP
ncbi:hypothetical protein LV779_17025 [Streptomyces thinghirensis]|nr:hypothetical protein [Streptomyces thinghirensis]